jgi:hypothetical protein
MKHGFSRIGKLRNEANALGAQVRRSRFQVQSLDTLGANLPSFASSRLCVRSSEIIQITLVAAKLPNEPILPGIADFRISDLRLCGNGGHRPPLQRCTKRTHSPFVSLVCICGSPPDLRNEPIVRRVEREKG